MATLWERLQASTKAATSAWSNPGGFSTESTYMNALNSEDAERVQRYQTLWKYYKGDHKKNLAIKYTKNGRSPDDNVTINLSRRVVDKGVNFLFGKPLTWQLSETDNTQQEAMLERIWGSPEKRMAFFIELAQNGGVSGDFFMQIVPPTFEGGLASVVNLDPSIVFPRTNPTNINEEWAFELRYMIDGDMFRSIHSLQDSGQGWEIWDERLVAGRWQMASEVKVWGFPFPLIIHGKNLPNANNYFGTSDLEDADINDTINGVASNINKIIRIFSHPIIYGHGLGKDMAELDTATAMMATNKDAFLKALELGRDTASSQEFLSHLHTSLAEITGVPQSDPERLKIGATSGFALRVLFNDLVLKTGIKQSLYGSAIVEVNRRLLEITGMGDNNITNLHWQDPLPVDEREKNDGDKFEIEAGLASKQSIATERGYDWKTEQERIQLEKVSDGNVGDMLLRAFETG